MYVELPWSLTAEELSAYRTACQALNLEPGPGGSRFSDAKATAAIFGPLLGARMGRQASVMALQPSAQLVGHKDAPILGTRVHLPLVWNPGCWAFHDGTWQQLREGQAYRMDPGRVHGAVNWGATVRLSLVVDS